MIFSFSVGIVEPVINPSKDLVFLEENDDNSDRNEKICTKNEEKIKENSPTISSNAIRNILNERKCPECNFEFAKSQDLFQHLIGKQNMPLKYMTGLL